MKSLEIVNKQINFANDYEYTQVVLSMDSAYEIKADLEVLEIIYKKNVDVKNLRIYIKTFSHDKDLLSAYNVGLDEEYHLTMEELLELKQWLEVNENE